MADIAKSFMLLLISEKCYDTYFLDHDLLNAPCFKALLSKGLGMGIIAGSLLVKVPQILKIFGNKSGEGINLVSVLMDLVAITFHLSYSFVNGFPFSAWGDSTFLALQTAIIAALILFYGGAKTKSFVFVIVYGSILYILNSGITPMSVLRTTQSMNIPILLFGKLSQAFTNFKNSSTGQLSAATCFMLFAGSLARIFTSIQETGDRMMVITFIASTFANGVIVAQLLYYWNKPTKGDSTKAKALPKKQKAKKVN